MELVWQIANEIAKSGANGYTLVRSPQIKGHKPSARTDDRRRAPPSKTNEAKVTGQRDEALRRDIRQFRDHLEILVRGSGSMGRKNVSPLGKRESVLTYYVPIWFPAGKRRSGGNPAG